MAIAPSRTGFVRASAAMAAGLGARKSCWLRSDGGWWDLGYPRSVQRPDGKIVTVYYFNDHKDQVRYIAATIWDPGLAP